ncbi:MAG: hypothetical protein ACRD3T_16360 [Terriglobia bacterium]
MRLADPANEETTRDRLVEQGIFLLKAFHDEFTKDASGRETEFWRGELAGWRHTLERIYGEGATHNIIDLVRHGANLPIPHAGTPAGDGYLGIDLEADF